MRKPTIKVVDGLETLWFGEEDQNLHVEVFAFPKQSTGISVYGPGFAKDTPKARVNWPSLGATTPEQARLFVKGIEVACKIAEELSNRSKS